VSPFFGVYSGANEQKHLQSFQKNSWWANQSDLLPKEKKGMHHNWLMLITIGAQTFIKAKAKKIIE